MNEINTIEKYILKRKGGNAYAASVRHEEENMNLKCLGS
jgi:hypothetical protein